MLIKVHVQRHISISFPKWNLLLGVWCSDCWAFSQPCLLMGSRSSLVLYFLLTNTYTTTSLSLKLVLQDFRPWGCTQRAFDILLPSNKSLVASGTAEILSIFCVAALGPWSAYGFCHVLWTKANCEQPWELRETIMWSLAQWGAFFVRRGHMWNRTAALF